MSQGDEFKLQGGAAGNTEREQGNEGGKNCDHAHDGMAVARKSLAFLKFQGFEQPQPRDSLYDRIQHFRCWTDSVSARQSKPDGIFGKDKVHRLIWIN